MKKARAYDAALEVDSQQSWPCFEQVQVIEEGKAIGVLLREFDGTISAVRIPIEQLAD